jgi:hypothetical protein
MKTSERIFYISIALLVLYFISGVVGIKSNVTGKTLCVDGNGEKNLEGIMCEETTVTYFGINIFYSFIPIMIFPILIVVGIKFEQEGD